MYIECKAESLNGPARIGRVTFSKTGRTIYYNGKEYAANKSGFKSTRGILDGDSRIAGV